MDDVIFAGTEKLAEKGFAEVYLNFEVDEKKFNGNSEISIGRKLFRDGTSEYFMNGLNCRLLDIQEFLSEVNTVSAKHGINPAHLLGLIASESGFNPKAQNPDTDAAGLLQFKPEVAERYGTTVDKILKMSRVEQMRYVDMYLKETLPNNPSLGQLYTSTLMPTYATERPDFELMAKDARYGSGNAQMLSLIHI